MPGFKKCLNMGLIPVGTQEQGFVKLSETHGKVASILCAETGEWY